MNSLSEYMRAASSSPFYPGCSDAFQTYASFSGGQRGAGFVLPWEIREEKSPSPVKPLLN